MRALAKMRLRRAGPAAHFAPALKDEARDQARRPLSSLDTPTRRLPSKSRGSGPPFATDCQPIIAQITPRNPRARSWHQLCSASKRRGHPVEPTFWPDVRRRSSSKTRLRNFRHLRKLGPDQGPAKAQTPTHPWRKSDARPAEWGWHDIRHGLRARVCR